MSGSIGANRIKREHVQSTVEYFIDNVLKDFPGYKKCCITGSYNAGTKKDHGDIDLVVLVIDTENLKKTKKIFKEHIENSPICLPFRAGKNFGKKAQMYGNIVTCEVPIIGQDGESVQVDVTIVRSASELDFQKKFLDMDAAQQTLITALVRTELCDCDYEAYEKIFDIDAPECQENQEKEFVLSASGLSYRLVTLDENKKTIDKKEIWRSTDWKNVIDLLSWLNFNQSYEKMLDVVDDVYQINESDSDENIEISKRVRRRILGIMKSMINIGPGEIGTEKGIAKEKCIEYAYKILNVE